MANIPKTLYSLPVYALLLLICAIHTEVRGEHLQAPAPDLTAPLIKHRLIAATMPDRTQIQIRAEITDETGIKQACVYYRENRQSRYHKIHLNQVAGTHIYQAVLPQVQQAGFDYYFQATDHAGNTRFHGNPQLPLTTLLPEPGNATAETAPDFTPLSINIARKSTNRRHWIWFGAAAISAAAIYHRHQSGDADQKQPRTATVTVNIPMPEPPP